MKDPVSDVIRLLGIQCRVRVGVPERERRRPQKILIDLDLETDVREAARRDDFRLAVDYWAAEKTVREAVEAKPWVLVEAIAEGVAALILARFALVRAVRVDV